MQIRGVSTMKSRFLVLLALFSVSACSPANDQPESSINELMLDVVTPTTNTLWGVTDPQTDADWNVFVVAASQVIAAGEQIKRGGSGPDDMTWAADPAWQAFADRLIDAANDARDAASAKNLDALFEANDVLYPPCEECHIQFHPGVGAEELN